jgi:hypothetical protein
LLLINSLGHIMTRKKSIDNNEDVDNAEN